MCDQRPAEVCPSNWVLGSRLFSFLLLGAKSLNRVTFIFAVWLLHSDGIAAVLAKMRRHCTGSFQARRVIDCSFERQR